MAILPGQMRGALLEYLVRRLLYNCGFIPVVADNIYTFRKGNLFFVNGRGAAHDADVFMEPPIQMPFMYPTRIIFECKAYSNRIGLPTIRNAFGLRNDINEFEIVTKDSLQKRKNNRRADYALEKRERYHYQVGVAGISEFSKPAVEFATNNKIPLMSLEWFLGHNILQLFMRINNRYVNGLGENSTSEIFRFLKTEYKAETHREEKNYPLSYPNDVIGNIIQVFTEIENSLFVGLIESGEIIFLKVRDAQSRKIFERIRSDSRLRATIHYSRRLPSVWDLTISPEYSDDARAYFEFYVPPSIMRLWESFGLSRSEAVNIKGRYFSTIFVFHRSQNSDLPVNIIKINQEWLEQVVEAEQAWASSS